MSKLEDLKNSVINGHRKDAKALTNELLEEKTDPELLLEEAWLLPLWTWKGFFQNLPPTCPNGHSRKVALTHKF